MDVYSAAIVLSTVWNICLYSTAIHESFSKNFDADVLSQDDDDQGCSGFEASKAGWLQISDERNKNSK